MTFMRVTRDQRGYENTFLLHSPRPGDPPRVLYWYRTAPGVRVGRRALDEDAIRTIEEQHPDIDFDWPALLEEAESVPAEVDRRPERPRRRPRPQEAPATESVPSAQVTSKPADGASTADAQAEVAPAAASNASAPSSATTPSNAAVARVEATPSANLPREPSAPRNPLLDQLVGREIAARLRARYAEVATRLAELPDDAAREAWQVRADALDPDRWDTAEAILHGIQHADRLFDELKRELPMAE